MFITFEGIDGSGKSVQADKCVSFLKEQDLSVLHCFDPGHTSVGNAIREILLNKKYDTMSSRSELLLYAAARSQLVKETIKPQLMAGGIVVSDRFYDSTTAYQGYGRQLDLEAVKVINSLGAHDLVPDITFIIDTDLQVAGSRIGEADRLESESMVFKERVRNGYLQIAEAEPERCYLIDGNRGIDAIQDDIRSLLKQKMTLST